MEKEPVNDPKYTPEFEAKILRGIGLMRESNLNQIRFDNFILTDADPNDPSLVVTPYQKNGNVFYLVSGSFNS